MNTTAIYFTIDPAGVRMATTRKVDELVRKIGRNSRNARTADVIAAIVTAEDGVKKLRRVLDRHWRSQYRGGGVYTIGPDEVRSVVGHFGDNFGLTCYGLSKPLSVSARHMVLQHFARGAKSRCAAGPHLDVGVVNELLAAGLVTRHQRRSGEIQYRGTERAVTAARRVATEQVPAPVTIDAPSPRTSLSEVVVVPEPNMSRAELLHQLEVHKDDPPDVLQQGYRYAMANMRERIGALAAVKDLTPAHKEGAAYFRRVYEHGQLGGAKATDYSAIRVDTSMGKNLVGDSGAHARAEFERGRKRLGIGSALLAVAEGMILFDRSARDVAKGMGYRGGAGQQRVIDLAREAASLLADVYFSSSKRSALRFDGERPSNLPEAFRSQIDTEPEKT